MTHKYRKIRGPQRQEPRKDVPPGSWKQPEACMREAWMRASMPTSEVEAPPPVETSDKNRRRNPVLLLTTPHKWAISAAAVLVAGALWWRQSQSHVPESACSTFESQLPQWRADAQAGEVVLNDILHDASLSDELISESL